jgi:hypothetical protein
MGGKRADVQDHTRERLEQEGEFVVPTVDRRGEIVDRQTHRARQFTTGARGPAGLWTGSPGTTPVNSASGSRRKPARLTAC